MFQLIFSFNLVFNAFISCLCKPSQNQTVLKYVLTLQLKLFISHSSCLSLGLKHFVHWSCVAVCFHCISLDFFELVFMILRVSSLCYEYMEAGAVPVCISPTPLFKKYLFTK